MTTALAVAHISVPPAERESALPSDATPAPAPSLPGETSGLAGIDFLLRRPAEFIDTLSELDDPTPAVRTLLLTAIVASMALGAGIGSYRGGWQILFAALKLPVVELLTAGICAPALIALNRSVHGDTSPRRDVGLILVALAFATLVAAGLAPLLLLAGSWGLDYHRAVLLLVGICLVSGALGLSVFLSGLRGQDVPGRTIVGVIMVGLLGLVGSQMTWVLRPYLVRPGTGHVPFTRTLEDDFLTSIATDLESAQGHYERVTGASE